MAKHKVDWNEPFKDKTLKGLVILIVIVLVIIVGFGLNQSKVKKVGFVEFQTEGDSSKSHSDSSTTIQNQINVDTNGGTIIGNQNNYNRDTIKK